MTKSDARKDAKKRLAALTEGALGRPVGMDVRNGVLLQPGIRTLLAFFPHGREPDVLPLMRQALASGARVALPRVSGDSMAFHLVESADGPCVSGAFGIREPPESAPVLFPRKPDQPDASPAIAFPVLVLVPGLAFTLRGERLGRGGGYYDRFLSAFLGYFRDRRAGISLAGVCWSEQLFDSLPVETHDVRVDCLYTERGNIVCLE